jgi:hypothetical protein
VPAIINSISRLVLELLDANLHLDVSNSEHKICCSEQIHQIVVQRLTGRYLRLLLGEMKAFLLFKLHYISNSVDELDNVNRI